MLTRGKHMVKSSLHNNEKQPMTPLEECKWWIKAGLDKGGFSLKYINDYKGYGVFAAQDFYKGEFLLQYVGQRISKKEGCRRESKQKGIRCLLYFFRQQCIDATLTSGRLGHLVNDCQETLPSCNCKMRLVETLVNQPALCLFATRKILKGEEILYDYGDDGNLWWRYETENTSVDDSDPYDSDPFDLYPKSGAHGISADEVIQVLDTVEDSRDSALPTEYPMLNVEESINEDQKIAEIAEIDDNPFDVYSDGSDGSEDVAGLNEDSGRDVPLTGHVSKGCDNMKEQAVLKHYSDSELNVAGLYPNQKKPEYVYDRVENSCDSTSSCSSRILPNFSTLLSTNGEDCISRPTGADFFCEDNDRDVPLTDHVSKGCDNMKEQAVLKHYSDIELNVAGLYPNQKKPEYVYDRVENSCDSTSSKILPNFSTLLSTNGEDCISRPTGADVVCEDNDRDVPLTDHASDGCDSMNEQAVFKHHSEQNDGECVTFSNEANDGATPLTDALICPVCDKHFKRKGGLTTHMKTHDLTNKTGQVYTKPRRLCPFCDVPQSRLPRHIETKHADIPEVGEALKLSKHSQERHLAFTQFRKEGIYNHNKKQVNLDNPSFMAERKGRVDPVACSKCKGFYERRLFYRHKEICIQDSVVLPKALHIDTVCLKEDQFSREILSAFQHDAIGTLCRKDPILRMIGQRLFQKNLRKVDKSMEMKKSVMSDMRLLARLFLAFSDICPVSHLEEMFRRKQFHILEQAIEIVTKPDGLLKYGVKNSLFYLLKSSVNFIVAHYLSQGEDSLAAETENFAKLLEMNRDVIFGDSVYAINLSRQEKLRMPEQQANAEEISCLSKFIQTKISEISSDFTFIGLHEFVDLRDSLCARLTLFNARRGGEPSRLKLRQLEDAWMKRWVDEEAVQKLEVWEQKLFLDLHIAYQPGKGNHLVPVLIPRDLVKPLKILTDPDVRDKGDVHEENVYVFPMTGKTMSHVHGWASINKMCKMATCKNPELLTASKQRHRISTLYCALEVPESDRIIFTNTWATANLLILAPISIPFLLWKSLKLADTFKIWTKQHAGIVQRNSKMTP